MLLPAIQIVEKREAPLLGSRVTESEGLVIKHEKKIKNWENSLKNIWRKSLLMRL